jgi:hypothetical protein
MCFSVSNFFLIYYDILKKSKKSEATYSFLKTSALSPAVELGAM